jgi:ribosome-associated protein
MRTVTSTTKKPQRSTAPTEEKIAHMVGWLAEKKARHILALDLSNEHTLCEGVIIANASSVRHGQGLAEFLLQEAGDRNYEFLSMEGHTVGQWILLDFNDVVVHIFQPESRDLFRLDDLWPSAGVLADTRGEQ